MRHSCLLNVGAALILFGLVRPTDAPAAESGTVIVVSPTAGALEQLAAREIQRYVYLRCGRLLSVATELPQQGDALLLAVDASQLAPQHYHLQTTSRAGCRVLQITGGDAQGTLFGAYRFAEHIGVRFYLHGDVIPDQQTAWVLPTVDEKGAPLFTLRGIQPFHDFPEGPDWWNADDYKSVLAQIAKLRMNFFGLHTYPEGGVGPEPLVWIGLPEDISADGEVRFSYPARHFTTANETGAWGCQPQKTSDYSFGADRLFDRDDFGPDYMRGLNPFTSQTTSQSNQLFRDVGRLLADVCGYARALGIKTCLGTETPLTIPKALQERLTQSGKDPRDPAVVRQLYEGLFQRIKQTHALDYYWFWTPEGWTWEGATDAQVNATVNDLQQAIAAAEKAQAPFTLGTCGWVLGPPQDRALFDRLLPKEMPLSCINREVGFTPVETGFARVQGRPKWAIPWMEDDPALIIPQLWAGRMRRDAADAHAYGCTGLMGIHWRTRILSPNVAALAHAAWEQPWNPEFGKPYQPVEPPRIEGRLGGNVAPFTQPIADTELDAVYQDVRWAVRGYRFQVPNGRYRVTLQFCEPFYREVGKRVFGAKLQGQQVIERLDIFAEVGPDKALDKSFENVEVQDGWLVLEFTNIVEHPSIAGLVIEGGESKLTRKINCGGPQWQDYEADLADVDPESAQKLRPRDLPVDDFYADWAAAEFGPAVSQPLAELFARLDGSAKSQDNTGKKTNLPRPSTWVNGPGGITPDARPWSRAQAEYAFVDEMAALRGQVQGPGNRERFDYWLNQFRYLRAVGQLNCLWGQYNAELAKVKAEQERSRQQQAARTTLMPLRQQMLDMVAEVHKHLLSSVTTWGGLGNVTNWQQHVLPLVFGELDKQLAEYVGQEALAANRPAREYAGEPRLFLPTTRSLADTSERKLQLKAIVLAVGTPRDVVLFYRAAGAGPFTQRACQLVGRGVYSVELPLEKSELHEYYVKATTATGQELVWPPTAPTVNQTVVCMP